MTDDPIRDADTDPKIWLFAAPLFGPLAAAQCYPLVFMTILNDAAEAMPKAAIGPVAECLRFVADHVGAHELEGAAQFLAAEIGEQLLFRINQRYPAAEGYSPVHIALMTLYRAIRDSHNEEHSSRN